MPTYLLALLLLVPTQLPPATKPSEMDLAKMRREAGEKQMERMKELIKSKERPIEFYGQVLDQFDHPVEGLDVEVHIKQFSPEVEGWFMNFKKFWTKTDGQGRFGVLGERGIELFVHDLQKEGYAKLSPLPDADGPDYTYGFDYANEIKPFVPDKKYPIVFHVRKMGRTTFLLEEKYCGFQVRPAESGKTTGWDLVQRRKIREGDKRTESTASLVCDLQIKLTFHSSDATWTITLSPGTPNGGIIVSDQPLYEAPEAGYQAEYTFTPEDRKPGKVKCICLRTREPPIYTRIEVRDIVANKDRFELLANTATNPYGDRNLEQAPDLPPNLHVQLDKEAKDALAQGKRPLQPDLPKMIPEAKESWLREESQYRERLRQESLKNPLGSDRVLLGNAIQNGNKETIRQLLEKGVDPNGRFGDQTLTVYAAIKTLEGRDEASRREVLLALLEKGGQLQLCPVDQTTQGHENGKLHNMEWCLVVAGMLQAGKPAVAEQLLRSSPDVLAVPSEGSRVLGEALEIKCFDLAEWLIDKGVQADQKLRDNMPWKQIIPAKRQRLLERLIAWNPRVDDKRLDGWGPLNLACKLGWAEGIDMLLSHGAFAGPVQPSITSPVEDILLSAPDPKPCLEVVMRHHRPLDIRAWVALGDLAKVKEMLQADPRAVRGPRPQVLTPLHVAARRGQTEIARLLLDAGADVDELGCASLELAEPSRRSFAPLHLAAISGDTNMTRLLLERGADVNKETLTGSALHIASACGRVDCCRILLEHGADVRAADSHKRTALHEAASGGHIEVIRPLVQYHADVDTRDVRGRTPLHYAVASKNQEAVRAMLAAGADPTIADNDGRVPSCFPDDWRIPDETHRLLVQAEQARKQSRAASTRP